MYLDGYFDEDIQQTAYSVNIYLRPRAKAYDLTRHSLHNIEHQLGPRILCAFSSKPKRASAKQRKDAAAESDSDSDEPLIRPKPRRKRKAAAPIVEDDSDGEDFTELLKIFTAACGGAG